MYQLQLKLKKFQLRLTDKNFDFLDKLDNNGNIVEPISRPIVPSGGVLKDINSKIEKLQHDSSVSYKQMISIFNYYPS